MNRRTLLKRAGIVCATVAAAGCAGPGGGGENETDGEAGGNESADIAGSPDGR
jgi:hypothetical protein